MKRYSKFIQWKRNNIFTNHSHFQIVIIMYDYKHIKDDNYIILLTITIIFNTL